MDEIRRILIPTDGSESVGLAVRKGVGLARLLGARVTALHVVDPTVYAAVPSEVGWSSMDEALRAEARRAVEAVETEARAAGVEVETRVVDGHPADVIVRESASHDLVVMGTFGRTGLTHLLVGSVAEKVIRHAEAPVLVVRLRRPDREGRAT